METALPRQANGLPRSVSSKGATLWATVIGAGLALAPIHNQWLTGVVTGESGEVGFFLPAFGTALWLMGALWFVSDHWRKLDWGDRRVYVPLLVIVAAIGLSGITADSWGGRVAPLLMGASLFSLYLASRALGRRVFLPLAVGAGIAALGIIVFGLAHPSTVTGGYIFEGNYDIATGYLLLGAMLFIHRAQWVLVGLVLLALFLSGSPEAVFAVALVAVAVLVRRDWSRRLAMVASSVALVAILWFGLGYGSQLYAFTAHVLANDANRPFPEQMMRPTGVTALGGRLDVIRAEMADIQLLGKGYNVTEFSKQLNVHNVPLVIVQQLGWPGVVAGLAWLWVSIWGLTRTRWTYVWVTILALSVFDHYIWTQIGPWWWAAVGVSTAHAVDDRLFRQPTMQGATA